jgi:hypothetical protein
LQRISSTWGLSNSARIFYWDFSGIIRIIKRNLNNLKPYKNMKWIVVGQIEEYLFEIILLFHNGKN